MMGMMVKNGTKIHMGSNGNEMKPFKNLNEKLKSAQLCKFNVTKYGSYWAKIAAWLIIDPCEVRGHM